MLVTLIDGAVQLKLPPLGSVFTLNFEVRCWELVLILRYVFNKVINKSVKKLSTAC